MPVRDVGCVPPDEPHPAAAATQRAPSAPPNFLGRMRHPALSQLMPCITDGRLSGAQFDPCRESTTNAPRCCARPAWPVYGCCAAQALTPLGSTGAAGSVGCGWLIVVKSNMA